MARLATFLFWCCHKCEGLKTFAQTIIMVMVVEGMVKPSALVHGSPATLPAPKGRLSARIT